MKVDLDLLEKAEAAATQGIWGVESWQLGHINYGDAKLIFLMRNNIKAMIAEIRAAREVVDAAEQIEEFFGSDDRDRIEKALEKYRAVK